MSRGVVLWVPHKRTVPERHGHDLTWSPIVQTNRHFVVVVASKLNEQNNKKRLEGVPIVHSILLL